MARDLVLDGENVCDVTVVTLGPEVVVRTGIDELRRDAESVTGLANAPFQYIPNPEIATDLLEGYRLSLVGEYRMPRDHEQAQSSTAR